VADPLDTVYVRDLSSGRLHKGARIGTTVATPEGCNLDDAGETEESAEMPLIEDLALLCERCFPNSGPDGRGSE
jgi:hypothetical protein